MFERKIKIDGAVYTRHEVTAIVHAVGSSTSAVVSSSAEGRVAERNFTRGFEDGMTLAEAEEWVSGLDEFAEYHDPVEDIIEALAPTLTDEQAATVPWAYPVWEAGTGYSAGDRVRYGGVLYKCLQAHESQDGWEPEGAPSLWARCISEPSGDDEDYPEWVQPDSTNPYMAGDRVRYGGAVYESTVDNNVWAPDVYGWEPVE